MQRFLCSLVYGSFQVSNPLGWDILDALGLLRCPYSAGLAEKASKSASFRQCHRPPVGPTRPGLKTLQHPRIPRPQPNQDLKGSSPSHCTGQCMHLWCLLPHRSLVCVVFWLFVSGFVCFFVSWCFCRAGWAWTVHRTMYRSSTSLLLLAATAMAFALLN